MKTTRIRLLDAVAAYMKSTNRLHDIPALRDFATAYELGREDREYLAGKCALPIGALS